MLFNLYLEVTICMALEGGWLRDKDVKVAHLRDAKLVGNQITGQSNYRTIKLQDTPTRICGLLSRIC